MYALMNDNDEDYDMRIMRMMNNMRLTRLVEFMRANTYPYCDGTCTAQPNVAIYADKHIHVYIYIYIYRNINNYNCNSNSKNNSTIIVTVIVNTVSCATNNDEAQPTEAFQICQLSLHE